MQRLIYADDMIKSLMDMTFYDDEGHTIDDFEDRLAIVKSFVDSVPTIDAEPVRYAKNIGTDYDEVDQFVCSKCGIELQDWRRVERDKDDGEETYHEYRFRHCPNCGARVDQ